MLSEFLRPRRRFSATLLSAYFWNLIQLCMANRSRWWEFPFLRERWCIVSYLGAAMVEASMNIFLGIAIRLSLKDLLCWRQRLSRSSLTKNSTISDFPSGQLHQLGSSKYPRLSQLILSVRHNQSSIDSIHRFTLNNNTLAGTKGSRIFFPGLRPCDSGCLRRTYEWFWR